MEKLNMVHNAVQELNNKYDDLLDPYEQIGLFEYSSDGYDYYVKFMNNHIWDSVNEEREFIEEGNDWEPLKEYLELKAINLCKFQQSILCQS